jgi:hypothetical protein
MADDAISVALEHVRWCRRQGMGCREILASAGYAVKSGREIGWDDTVWIIARIWWDLPRAGR